MDLVIFSQLDAHLLAQTRVQIAQRLVHQQHFGIGHHGARHRDSLLLPAAQVRRGPVFQPIQLNAF